MNYLQSFSCSIALMLFSGVCMADAIMRSQAMFASTIAEYFVEDARHELHERSRFKRFKGAWKYLDGKS